MTLDHPRRHLSASVCRRRSDMKAFRYVEWQAHDKALYQLVADDGELAMVAPGWGRTGDWLVGKAAIA